MFRLLSYNLHEIMTKDDYLFLRGLSHINPFCADLVSIYKVKIIHVRFVHDYHHSSLSVVNVLIIQFCLFSADQDSVRKV